MIGNADPEPLKVLASVVQPPEGYARGELKVYRNSTPLNRLVDAVPPESDTAREFSDLAKRIAAGKATPQQWQEARNWLLLWRDNDAKLQPQLAASELTAELAPVSRTLSQVAAMGLRALDDLQNHHVLDADALNLAKLQLDEAAKPQAVLVDKIVPSVALLVQASSAQ